MRPKQAIMTVKDGPKQIRAFDAVEQWIYRRHKWDGLIENRWVAHAEAAMEYARRQGWQGELLQAETETGFIFVWNPHVSTADVGVWKV
jgi:hypothetical protein